MSAQKPVPNYSSLPPDGAIENAVEFTAYMFFGAFNKIVERFSTFLGAASRAAELEAQHAPKPAAVYAISPEGFTHFIPPALWKEALAQSQRTKGESQ